MTPGTGYGIAHASHQYAVGVPVLRDVSFELVAGSVHGLVGENGSGKSTLIKLLTGVMKPQLGVLTLDDEEVSFGSPGEAQRAAVAVVHQDYHLFPDLSVAQNIMGVSGSLPRRRWTRTIHKAGIQREVSDLLKRLGIDLAADALVRSLDPAERKFVEIARAMRLEPRFLILDEPTASLEPRGSRAVLDLLDRLRGAGVGLAFVSHRLTEVLAIADRITILRDGGFVGCVPFGEVDEEGLAGMIVGGERERANGRGRRAGPTEVKLRCTGVKLQAQAPAQAIDLRRGEILGLTGLLGSGAATVVRMIGGALPLRGQLEVDGKPVRLRNPRDAGRAGIGFIPEDRKGEGCIPAQSVAVNLSLASLDAITRGGVIRKSLMRELAHEYRDKLDIKARSVEAEANTLSGGNLQKVLIAKWLASSMDVLAIEEPTHGVDIGAKVQVHRLLRDFAEQGGSIVVSLADVEEALELCDRIAVFRHGAIVDVLDSAELTGSRLTVMSASEQLEKMIEGTGDRVEIG